MSLKINIVNCPSCGAAIPITEGHSQLTCSYCGNIILSIDDAEVDHIIPFSEGGATDISNAQLLHRHCNRVKNNTMDDEDWEGGEEGQITVP